ncbi:MAG TPA: single-stranded DNA-binding protein [Verrucomicrobiales bacterium]|nr:single-stranded DNA-binding protein [Verrucomicrobiales bacterium]|tara:strand:+ start:215 stop:679 length:465 start_codon:yes stop_codon:yes gene_type:complete
MPNYNKVLLMGRLTRDPEVKYSANGTAITNIGLAVNRNWRNQDGQMQEEVTFVDVTAFGKRGEAVGQYLKKGKPIFVEGHLRLEQWDDKQTGQKRSKLTIIMDAFEFIDSRGEGEGGSNFSGGGGGGAAPSSGGSSAPAQGGGGGFAEDDDVPF